MKADPGIHPRLEKTRKWNWCFFPPGRTGILVIITVLLIFPVMGITPENVIVTGHVYEGTRGDDSPPAEAVRLLIVSSSDPDRYDPGDIIQETRTDNAGLYEFQFLPRATGIDPVMPEYYHVVLEAPAGSEPVEATSSSGTPYQAGWIVLRYPFVSAYLDGNDFWIRSSRQGNDNQTPMDIPYKKIARILPSLQVSPSSGHPGDEVTATGRSFSSQPPVTTISVETAGGLVSLLFEGITVGENIQVDPDGSFSTTFLVPEGISPGPHPVRAVRWEDVAESSFTILNTPPEAVIDASPLSGSVPLQVQFDASQSSDPDGFISTYLWNLGDGTQASGVAAGHTYNRPGRYEVILTVTDNLGESGTVTRVIQVNNSPPVAVATAVRVSSETPLTFRFDGSRSYDPEGSIREYNWDFGDGTEGSGITTEHAYSGPGGYNVSLTVTDNQGESGTASVMVPVDNSPPVAVVDASPTSGSVPLLVQFDASRSHDPDGQIKTFLWNFGDGSQGSGITTENTYTGPGRYTARLTVTDDHGASDSESLQIGVNNSPPVAVATADPESGSNPLTVRFDGSQSYDPDGKIVSCLWDFGDGSREETTAPVHVYQNPGTYLAVLTVSDDGGMTGHKSIDITVGNMPPVARISVSASEGNAPMNVQIDGSGSTDPDDDNLTFSWEYGDGESGIGSTVSHTYREEGSYPVSLRVSDPYGNTDRATVTIRVVPPFPVWLVLVIISGIVITINEIRRRKGSKKKERGERIVGPGEILPEGCEYPVPKPGYEIRNGIEYGSGTTRELPDISVDFRSGIWKEREGK